jgi:hypothetical protein
MVLLLFALGMVQVADAPSQSQAATPPPPKERSQDVYTECFLRELSILEKRDVRNSPEKFSKKNAGKALKRCQDAKAQLTAQIGGELASDPAFADSKLRSLELQNRVGMKELPLLLLIYAKGK